MKRRRVSITSDDIQFITGKSKRYAQNLMGKMKEHYRKEKHQFITFQEFCHYTGIQYAEIEHLID
ncbi:hypothetical protein [Flavobacterium sp.]|uniref:hypothetical protein n=1 Tax=Flavobacterium sp. TaxID=239 RepID=UPI002FD8A269